MLRRRPVDFDETEITVVARATFVLT